MAKEQLYTPEGYQKLVDEREYLIKTRREEVKNDIAVARSFGDLSENSEYDEARNEQAKVEARIKELDELIEHAVIIEFAIPFVACIGVHPQRNMDGFKFNYYIND